MNRQHSNDSRLGPRRSPLRDGTWRLARVMLWVTFVLVGVPQACADSPNIIWIMADDLGYGDLGCYGQPHIETPNLDRLAAEGARFTQCYAGSTVCAPSRSVLMTGQHTGHTRVRGNTGKGGVRGLGGAPGRVPLQAEDVTIAEVLKQAGYRTAIVGKWGLGEPGTPGLPNDQGFDHWFGYLNQRRAHDYYPEYLWLNRDRFPLVGNLGGKSQQYSHDLMTAFALNFVQQQDLRPFFLYLPYTIPHDRFEVPDLGPYAERDWPPQAKTYAAMVSRLDQHVGLLLEALATEGIDKNTLVVFCSDNGAANRYDGLFNSSGDLRGRKRDLYEGGLRTPMIVRWPGQIEPGRVDDRIWWFADALPTLADLAQAPVPANIDGQSVLSWWLKPGPAEPPRPLYWEFYERGFQQAVRLGKWKLIRRWNPDRVELYDLEQDPGETTNLAETLPERVRELNAMLRDAHRPSQHWSAPCDGSDEP